MFNGGFAFVFRSAGMFSESHRDGNGKRRMDTCSAADCGYGITFSEGKRTFHSSQFIPQRYVVIGGVKIESAPISNVLTNTLKKRTSGKCHIYNTVKSQP